MIKRTVSYEDFNGNQITEELYFNISKREAMNEAIAEDGLATRLNKVVASKDNKQIFKEMTEIIGFAYGEKSEDGRRFNKSPEIRRDFENSLAYDTFLMDLLSGDTQNVVDFVNGILPNDLEKVIEEQEKKGVDVGAKLSDQEKKALDEYRALQSKTKAEEKPKESPKPDTNPNFYGAEVKAPTDDEIEEYLRRKNQG